MRHAACEISNRSLGHETSNRGVNQIAIIPATASRRVNRSTSATVSLTFRSALL